MRLGRLCDDFGACIEIPTSTGAVLIAVASDGAGSAPHSAKGARIATRAFVKSVTTYFRTPAAIEDISTDTVSGWMDDIRNEIYVVAKARDAPPRDFAATLVASIVGEQRAAFVHVGDGASVFKSETDGNWVVPTWPAQGEYAATTCFVTDDPEPKCQFKIVEQSVEQLAVFSDGMERLALDFVNRCAFAPFFSKMFGPLKDGRPGKNRALSRALKSFLDSPVVCERTDDDKTLILARRIVEA